METRMAFAFLFALLSLMLPGCANGILSGTIANDLAGTGATAGTFFNGAVFGGLYSHTTNPLTFNREPTELLHDLDQARSEIKHLQAGTMMVSIRYGKNGIGDVARENGMKVIYYADIEQKVVLFGLWRESILHLYGR
jgi:hypothetical protein